MYQRVLTIAVLAIFVPIAGCFGGDDAFEPGTKYKETGNTVHLRMWVEDMVMADIYPGMKANLWAFCAEPANPNDEYSRNAIEYREPSGVVQRLQSDNTFIVDEDATSKCSVPGPQLRVKQGDRVIVDFSNNHFHPHTIHWHGQMLDWEDDGVPGTTQDSVVPTTEYRYDFIAKRAGTLWYHCHVDTQFHVMQGLYGVIIVEPQDKSHEPKDIDREYTLVYSNLIRDQVEFIPPRPGEVFNPHAAHLHGGPGQCGPSGFPNCQNPAVDPEPDVFLVNGVSFPNTMAREDTVPVIEPGERIKIRFLNAGPFSMESIHLHGHDMLITHIDGNPVPAPYYVDTFLFAPGQRIDVVVEGTKEAEGIWVFHDHMTNHVTNDRQYPGGMLTKLVYKSHLDDVTPFDLVERPGGQMVRFPVTIPDDYFDATSITLPSPQNQAALGAWTFPVDEACAVKTLTLRGGLTSGSPATAALNEVTFDLVDPAGTNRFSTTLGGPDGFPAATSGFSLVVNETSTPSLADLGSGEWSVGLLGTNVDATATLEVVIDYYSDLAAADYAANNATPPRDLCGKVPDDVLAEYGYI